MSDDNQFKDDEYAMKILLHRPAFQADISNLRDKWSIPPEGFADNHGINAWKEHITANGIDSFEDEILVLLQNLGLSERWQQGVGLYVQTNNPMMLRVQSPGEVKFRHDGAVLGKDRFEYTNVRSVWIRVFADSTEREIREDFQYAKGLFGPKPKKKQKPKDLERDLEVLRRNESGQKTAEIVKWLNDNYPESFNDDSVAKIILRMKQKLK